MKFGINIESGLNKYKNLFDNECSSLDSLNNSENQDFGFIMHDKFLNNIFEESPDISVNKKKYFKIIKEKRNKVGRKKTNYHRKNGKTHSKYDFDNIIRKVQVHFHNFIISFVNEILKSFGIKKKFLNTDYTIKKNVKKANVDSLKSKEIGKILCENLSTKYRKQYTLDKDKNKKLYLEVIEHDSIRKLLSETYINIFRNFYYKNKRDLNEYNLKIKLSNKIKTYQDFLTKLSKDGEYIEKIKKIVERCYLPKKIFHSELE